MSDDQAQQDGSDEVDSESDDNLPENEEGNEDEEEEEVGHGRDDVSGKPELDVPFEESIWAKVILSFSYCVGFSNDEVFTYFIFANIVIVILLLLWLFTFQQN